MHVIGTKPFALYNEIDPFAAQWLRNLIAAGHIAPGEVDERSIEDVTPDDLRGFTQCHFFAGIGVWSHSLRLAGWPDDRPVWTGSCPCQPFSAAGKGDGFADERHLWPHFFHLISERRPQHVFGEQVAAGNANGSTLYKLTWKEWDTPSGLCRLRQRASVRRTSESGPTGWPTPVVGDMTGGPRPPDKKRGPAPGLQSASALAGWVTPTSRDWKDSAGMTAQRDGKERLDQLPRQAFMTGWPTPTTSKTRSPSVDAAMNMHRQDGSKTQQRLQDFAGITGPLRLTVFGEMRTGSFCRDGKWRPVEPGTFPLVDGAAARLGRVEPGVARVASNNRVGRLKGTATL